MHGSWYGAFFLYEEVLKSCWLLAVELKRAVQGLILLLRCFISSPRFFDSFLSIVFIGGLFVCLFVFQFHKHPFCSAGKTACNLPAPWLLMPKMISKLKLLLSLCSCKIMLWNLLLIQEAVFQPNKSKHLKKHK